MRKWTEKKKGKKVGREESGEGRKKEGGRESFEIGGVSETCTFNSFSLFNSCYNGPTNQRKSISSSIKMIPCRWFLKIRESVPYTSLKAQVISTAR